MKNFSEAYVKMPDEALRKIVIDDYNFTQALLLKHPEMSQDAGFELFDAAFVSRYWKKVLGAVSGAAGSAVLDWALEKTIEQIAEAIAHHYGLPPTALAAAVALAILLVRAAKAAKSRESK